MLSTIAPIDLSDEVAVRLHLQTFGSGLIQPATNSETLTQATKESLFKPKVIDDLELKKYVQDRVKEFDEAFRKVIDEVEYNLKDTDYRTIILSAESEALSTDLTALEGDVTSVTNDLATNYATITEIAGVYATQSAVGAIYGVEVNANGHVSGYKSVATGQASVFQIYAEKFAVSSSSTQEGYSPFQIDTVNHKINMTSDVAIDGDLVVAGTITTNHIASNSITATKLAVDALDGKSAKFEGNRGVADGQTWTITAVNIAPTGGAIHGEAPNFGVAGVTTAANSKAIHGLSTATGSTGVYGQGVLRGVWGESAGYGLYTQSQVWLENAAYPFTGAHITLSLDLPEVGDIVEVSSTFNLGVTNVIAYSSVCTASNSKKVFGVYNGTTKDILGHAQDSSFFGEYVDDLKILRKVKAEYVEVIDNIISAGYNLLGVNALGEGMINVCSENGDILAGDYICSSNVPGKGMKQADDILHNYTVAKALESVIWANELNNTKMIACTYHCG